MTPTAAVRIAAIRPAGEGGHHRAEVPREVGPQGESDDSTEHMGIVRPTRDLRHAPLVPVEARREDPTMGPAAS